MSRAPKKPASHPDCRLPRGPDGKVPKLTSLPKEMEGCVFAVHGNSTARYPKGSKHARPALSLHTSVSDKRTLLNVHEPLLFADAKLALNQSAARAGYKAGMGPNAEPQVVTWPKARKCAVDADCKTDRGETCLPKSKRCGSKRRKKTPMGYVIGAVYPDPGEDLGPGAISVAMYAGEFRDGKWLDAKFHDVKCPEKDKSLCPAVTQGRLVRFIPNWTDSGAPQPFATQLLAGYRRRRRK